jgi:DNA replication protein DnaC
VQLQEEALVCSACSRRIEAEQEQRTRDEKVAQWRVRVERCGALRGVPPFAFARLSNSEFVNRVSGHRLLAVARRYQLDRSLVFTGPTGCGKTALTIAMLHRLAEEEVARTLAGAPLANPSQLLRRLRGMVWTDGLALAKARRQAPLGEGECELIQRAFEAPALVIDELGFEPLTEVVFEVANCRYLAGLPTIITTGQTPAAFAAKYGDACWRRFAERGAVVSEWPEQKSEAG